MDDVSKCAKTDYSYAIQLRKSIKEEKENQEKYNKKDLSRQDIINEKELQRGTQGGGKNNSHIVNIKLTPQAEKKALKALMEYKNTNNGVLYVNNKVKKGGNGVFLSQINASYDSTYTASQINEDIKLYAMNMFDEIKVKSTFPDVEDTFMYHVIYEKECADEDKIKDKNSRECFNRNELDEIMHIELQTALRCNSHHVGEIKDIFHDYDKKYELYALKSAPLFVTPNKVKLDFTCYGYNFDVVTAYEKNYYDNFANLLNFINEQNSFIRNMEIRDKITINDYTKKYAFQLYTSFIWSSFEQRKEGSWLDSYKRDIRKKTDATFIEFGFGDSFFNQIYDVIGPEKFRNRLIEKKIIDEKFVFSDMNDYWIKISKRVDCIEESIFADYLNGPQWTKILEKFIYDIRIIISKAPMTTTSIYCYRGVSDHYIRNIKNNEIIKVDDDSGINIKVEHFTNLRFGSFSINFNSSVRYAKNDKEGKHGTMYRVTILPGIRVLYIPSLSFASDEFEILHDMFGVFTAEIGGEQENYNNKNNKFGILSHDANKFFSADIIFSNYVGLKELPENTDGIVIKIDESLAPFLVNELKEQKNIRDKAMSKYVKKKELVRQKSIPDIENVQ
jgi:hypothetical protein